MNRNDFVAKLTQQAKIVDKMRANLDSQNRFLSTSHMKGLHRLMQELAVMIDQFSAIRSQLLQEIGWQQVRECKELFSATAVQYDAMVADYRLLLEAAVIKRKNIASAIGKLKQHRHMKNHYVRQWQVMSVGHCFSAKG